MVFHLSSLRCTFVFLSSVANINTPGAHTIPRVIPTLTCHRGGLLLGAKLEGVGWRISFNMPKTKECIMEVKMISNKLISTTYSAPWSKITNSSITNKDTKKDNYVCKKALPVYNVLLSFLLK